MFFNKYKDYIELNNIEKPHEQLYQIEKKIILNVIHNLKLLYHKIFLILSVKR